MLFAGLRENSKSTNEDLRSTCNSALWEIYEGEVELDIRKEPSKLDVKKSTPSLLDVVAKSTDEEPEDLQTNSDPGNESSRRQIKVMISYQWDVQKNMVHLKEILSKTNFSVWMDVDKMSKMKHYKLPNKSLS